MLKKILATIAFTSLALTMPVSVIAEENCVQVYGGGVVCGAETPKVHKPVQAGLADNPFIIGFGFVAISASLFIISRKHQARLSEAK